MRTPPADLYGIEDEFTSWCFNRAVQTYGNALENRLHVVSDKAKKAAEGQRKAQQELDRWLSSADTKAARGRFRDPMAKVKA